MKEAPLNKRFILSPFSVLDTRLAEWRKRRTQWISLGMKSELGREEGLTYGESLPMRVKDLNFYRNKNKKIDEEKAKKIGSLGAIPATQYMLLGRTGKYSRNPNKIKEATELDMNPGISIFDPVLCELLYSWFCPVGGEILDPFAGGSVRGITAVKLDRKYTGIDLSDKQVIANNEQYDTIIGKTDNRLARWINGDSINIKELAPGNYDFIFSCPPYYDLEVYSDDPRDLSNMGYDKFLELYGKIIFDSVSMLKDNRFACFVVGDVRDEKGFYRNFVSETITAFQKAGAKLYNEAILINAIGSLPIRISKQFTAGRKLGKMHQNVLVFLKGDSKKATEVLDKEIDKPVLGTLDW